MIYIYVKFNKKLLIVTEQFVSTSEFSETPHATVQQ